MSVTQFPNAATVPIVGQPLAVLGYTIVVSVQCRCAQTGIVTLVMTQSVSGQGSGVGVCPGCRRALHIHAVHETNGGLQFEVAMGETVGVVKPD